MWESGIKARGKKLFLFIFIYLDYMDYVNELGQGQFMETCCGLDFIRQLVRNDYVEIMDWWTLFWETFFSTLVECTFLLLTMTDLAPGPVNLKFDLPIMWNIRRLSTERFSKHGYVWWKIIVKIMLLILFRLMDSSVREYCKLWYCMEWLHVLATE